MPAWGGRRGVRRVITIKRAYEDAADGDGTRVLVDRLWPRGVSREKAAIDEWLKQVAPSDDLRKWFGHDPAKWDEFRTRYFGELDGAPDAVASLRQIVQQHKAVTLVYAARDELHNNAVALREYLER